MNKRDTLILRIVIIIAAIICLVLAVSFFNRVREIGSNEFRFEESESLYGQSEEQLQEIGNGARITSATILKRTTGTGPFDEDNSEGNDKDADNNIVRSFDQVVWTLEMTMGLKNGAGVENYKGGRIEIEATLPESCKDVVEWDLSSMAWAENASITENGTKFLARYQLNENEVTIPGKQTLVLVLQVKGAPNNLSIVPTFKMKLSGNTTSDIKTITDSAVKVSASPKIDVEIRNYNVGYSVERNSQNKKIYKYAMSFKLLGDNASKGVKGIEVPKGDLSFDITYNMKRRDIGGTEYTDLTRYLELYNYKPNNQGSANLAFEENILSDLPSTSLFSTGVYPYSSSGDRRRGVYQNGNVTMADNGNGTIHVTISDYGFSSTFPDRTDWGSYASDSGYSYEKNIGFISVEMFYMIVDCNSETMMNYTESYIEMEAKNISVRTVGNRTCTTEVQTTNNKITANHIVYGPGSYSKEIHFYSDAGGYLASPWGAGNASRYMGTNTLLHNRILISENNDKSDWIYGLDCLTKFDDKAFEPILFDDDSEYSVGGDYGETDMTFNILYAGKPNKTGWGSDEEMIQTKMDELVYFDTLQELKNAGYICVATLAESQSGVVKSGINVWVRIRMKIKETYGVNKVAQAVNDVFIYNEGHAPNRATQTHLLTTNRDNFPEKKWIYENLGYIKTQYDDNGQMVTGTHGGGIIYGNSLLVLGANQSISIRSVELNSDTAKVNYDIGKNETVVRYKVTPSLPATGGAVISGVGLKITAKIPAAITYVEGSCEYGEPQISTNEFGDAVLVWYMNGLTVGEPIESIYFKAKLNEDTQNGQQFTATAITEEYIPAGSTAKIGDSPLETRTATSSILIINLSSYSLFKATETPVIEVNDVVHYKVTAINKTDYPSTEFQLLDVLPYNGDGRGTSFSGTYTVQKIDILQTRMTTSEIIANNNITLYTTNSTSVRSGVTAKDSNLGRTSIWQTTTIGANLNTALTGYALVGTLGEHSKIEIDIYLKTNGNKPYDKYKNFATAQTSNLTEEMTSPIIEVNDVKRILEGTAWLDDNENGLMDNNETKFSGLTVTIRKTDGTAAKDINGNTITSTITDTNGHYRFEDMVKADYKVTISSPGIKFKVTSKNAGSDEEINNKFNSNRETDAIQKLNSIAEPVINDQFENAGFQYIRYNITTEANSGGTINGNGQNPYERVIYTEDSTKEIKAVANTNYRIKNLKIQTKNDQGTVISEEELITNFVQNGTSNSYLTEYTLNKFINMSAHKHVIVEFEKVPSKVIVHHYKVNTETSVAPDVTINGYVDDEYRTYRANIPEYYRLIEEPINKNGIMKVADTIVTYYYMYQGWIEVTKRDNETGAVLPNTKFGVYSDANCTQLVEELTTGTDGKDKTELLDEGTYYIKETESPSTYYKLNEEIKTVNIVNAGETYQVEYRDIPLGYIEITKKDDFTGEILANAQFKIFADSNLTQLVTSLVTGTDGKAKTDLIEAGTYYIQEVQPPEHYNLNESISTVRVWEAGATVPLERRNIPHRGYIETVKKDNQTGEIITKESATFALYEWSVTQNTWVKPTHIVESEYDGLVSDGIGYKLKEKVAGTKGTYKTGTLYYNAQNDGKFKVVEYDSPLGYTLENQEKVITITRDGQTESQDFRDEEIKGTINFIKLDKEINYNNSNYPLGTAQADATIEGAVYGLYAKENILSPDTGAIIYIAGELIELKSTDSEGKITWNDLYLGKYYIKEIAASIGYVKDPEEHIVDLMQFYIDNMRNENDRTTTNVVYENRESYSLYLNPERRVISAEQVKKQSIKILKITSYIDLSDEDLRVQGATFKAYLVSKLDVNEDCTYRDIMDRYYNPDTHTYNLPEEAEAMTFRVNHDGEFLGELVTDENGEVTSEKLAYGRYVLIEVDGAADTQVAGEVVTDLELARPFFVRILEYSDTPQQDRIITDPHMTAFIEVNKKDTTTRKNVRKAGAEYLINKITTSNNEIDGEILTREPVIQTVAYPSRIEVGTLENPYKTDEEGRFTTAVSLNMGLYELVEVKAPSEYVVNGYEAHTENGEIVSDSMEATRFKIATTEVYEENPDIETDGYNGGNKNGNILTIEQYNTPQMGTITITKLGEYQESSVETDGKYIISYAQKPVEGAEFIVYAKEDIYTNDNQIDEETGERTKYYVQGQEIIRITTGADGKAYAENLPLGKYIVKENIAGEGYVLNTEVKEVDITLNTLDVEEILEGEVQKTAVNIEEKTYINERQKVKIEIFKTDEENPEKRLAYTEFSLYAKDDIRNRAGEIIVPRDGLVGVAETGENGVATFEEDLPLGRYYAKETKRPYGYKTNENIIDIFVTYAGQTTRTSEISEEMQDERMDARVVVHHYIENTTISLSEDQEQTGRVFDEYRTEPATDIPEYYMLIEIPSNSEGQMTEAEIEVIYYYKLRPYTVTINYLEEDEDDDDTNNNVIHEVKEIINQTYETQIRSLDEAIEIPGYEYVRADKEVLSVGTVEEENYINLYYKKADYKYRVEYYYNGEIDEDKTEEREAEYKSIIEEYEDKIEDGYRFEKDENAPLEITYNEETNVIKVYYIPDDEQTKELRYRVEYYVDGVQRYEDAHSKVETVQVLKPDLLELDKSEINTVDKYEGYVVEKITINDVEVERLPDEVDDKDVIRIYYERKTTEIIVKYVDKEGNEIKEEYVEEGKYEDIFDIDKVDDIVEGYKLYEKSEEGKTHFENETKTIVFIYEKEARVKIKYVNKITGEEIEEEEKEGVVDEEYTTEPKEIEGYKLVREEIPANKDGKMTEEDIEVKYYYIKESKIRVQYLDLDTEKEISKEVVKRGYEGDLYSTEQKNISGYEYVKVEGDVSGEMKEYEKVIRYYYTKEIPKAEPVEETPSVTTYYITNNPETSSTTTITKTTSQNIINSNTVTVRNNTTNSISNNTVASANKTNTTGPATGDEIPEAMVNIIAWVIIANIVQISVSKLHSEEEE